MLFLPVTLPKIFADKSLWASSALVDHLNMMLEDVVFHFIYVLTTGLAAGCQNSAQVHTCVGNVLHKHGPGLEACSALRTHTWNHAALVDAFVSF